MNRTESFYDIHNLFFHKCEESRKEREQKVEKVTELNSEVGKDEWIEELTKSVTKLKNDKGNYISTIMNLLERSNQMNLKSALL